MDSFKKFLSDVNVHPTNKAFIESVTHGYDISNSTNDDISISYIQFLESLHTEDTKLRSAIVEAYIETHVLNEARIMRKLGNTLNKVKNAVSGIGAKRENATDVKKYTQSILDFIGDINNFKTGSSAYIKQLVDKLALMDDDEVKKASSQIVTQIQGALSNTIFNSEAVGHDELSPKMFMNNASQEAGKKVALKLMDVLKNTFPHTSQVNADKARELVETWWNKNMAAEMGGYRPVFANAAYKIIKDPNAPTKTEEPAEPDDAKDTAVPPTTPPPSTPMTEEDKKKYYEKERARKADVQANLTSASPLAGSLYSMGSAITLSPEAKEKLAQKQAAMKAGIKNGIGNVWNKLTGKNKPIDNLTPTGTPNAVQPTNPAPTPAPQVPQAKPTQAPVSQARPAVKKPPVRKATKPATPKAQPTRKPVKPNVQPSNNTAEEDKIMASVMH